MRLTHKALIAIALTLIIMSFILTAIAVVIKPPVVITKEVVKIVEVPVVVEKIVEVEHTGIRPIDKRCYNSEAENSYNTEFEEVEHCY